MNVYKDQTGRLWQLVRKLPGGALELFDAERKRFMTINATTAKIFTEVKS